MTQTTTLPVLATDLIEAERLLEEWREALRELREMRAAGFALSRGCYPYEERCRRGLVELLALELAARRAG
jgi:hypothetical protein